MTRIVALLSFYDEPLEFLHRLITSLPTVGVTHLVALDGKYDWYPAEHDTSPIEQHTAIEQASHDTGLDLSLHVHGTWPGEIEKRTHLFQMGERVTTPNDWYLIVDGDEQYTHAPPTLRDELADTIFDVAQATMLERTTPGSDTWTGTPFPKFFRAIRGLHVTANHYTYRTPDRRYLWGNARTTRLEPRIPVDVTVKHFKHERPVRRRTAAMAGYALRDNTLVEHHHPMRFAA